MGMKSKLIGAYCWNFSKYDCAYQERKEDSERRKFLSKKSKERGKHRGDENGQI